MPAEQPSFTTRHSPRLRQLGQHIARGAARLQHGLFHNPSIAQIEHPIRLAGGAQVVGGEQHAMFAAVGQGAQAIDNLARGIAVQIGGRFIGLD